MVAIKTNTKRCLYCGRWFKPYARMKRRQKTCGREICRRSHKRELNRQWWAKEHACRQARYKKVRDRRRQEGYWKKYRDNNSDYVEANRKMSRERMRRLRARRKEAKELLADPVGQLEGLRSHLAPLFATQELLGLNLRGKNPAWHRVFATQELLARGSEGILKFLIAREMFATRDLADKAAGNRVSLNHEDIGTEPRSHGVSLREAAHPPS